ncbi:MAG TPA: pyridoxal-phosphate dependent enzyme [Archangium sp.]|nr:pyridoxal-phosphate dependent enzyme [Archangium sp.]
MTGSDSEHGKSQAFWDALANVYEEVFSSTLLHHEDLTRAMDEAVDLAVPARDTPLRVLDLGCGTGWATRRVRERRPGGIRATLVDLSPGMLEQARSHLRPEEIEQSHAAPLQSDALWSQLARERFDVVLASFSVHHLLSPEKERLFGRISQVLAEEGVFLLLDAIVPSAFGKTLARRAEARMEGPRFRAAVALGDGALATVPPEERSHHDHPERVSDLLGALERAGLEGACVWQVHETALFVARRLAEAAAVEVAVRPVSAAARLRTMPSVLGAVGWTPMVALDRLCERLPGRVLLKLEYLQPGHSKKDRPALAMVRAARASGQLAPGQHVIELTSGNTGTGLAIACAVLGHPFIAVMSEGNSPERAAMMRALGAEVVLVPQAGGANAGRVSGADLELVEQRTQELVAERGAFRANQFTLEANVLSHEYGTGREILEQTGGELTAFVDFIGSGGTFTGVARSLKAARPSIACYGVEPEGAAFLAGQSVTQPSHRIQGGGYSRALPLFDASLCDGYVQIGDKEAIHTARELARREGIFGGFSTGANVAAALRLLRQQPGGVVVCLACDSGLKYLSTDLYGPRVDRGLGA